MANSKFCVQIEPRCPNFTGLTYTRSHSPNPLYISTVVDDLHLHSDNLQSMKAMSISRAIKHLVTLRVPRGRWIYILVAIFRSETEINIFSLLIFMLLRGSEDLNWKHRRCWWTGSLKVISELNTKADWLLVPLFASHCWCRSYDCLLVSLFFFCLSLVMSWY